MDFYDDLPAPKRQKKKRVCVESIERKDQQLATNCDLGSTPESKPETVDEYRNRLSSGLLDNK